MKNILILCTGYPYHSDMGVGYHVSQALEKMELPDNVDLLEVGESANEFDYLIDGREKMIVVDSFQTKQEPGTIVRLKASEVPMTVDGLTDLGKYHVLDTLGQLEFSGKCPDTIFMGLVPKNTNTMTPTPELTPTVQEKIPELIERIMEEIKNTD